MKKNREFFTENEIELLKRHVNIAEKARKHDLNPLNNHVYKILRQFPKTQRTKSRLFISELEVLLDTINKQS